jgi:hypothetical protein
MNYKLTIDLNSAVEDFYPGLSQSDVKLIASEIYNVWDYTSQYQLIADKIDEMAETLGIGLENKDGVYEKDKPQLTVIKGGKD